MSETPQERPQRGEEVRRVTRPVFQAGADPLFPRSARWDSAATQTLTDPYTQQPVAGLPLGDAQDVAAAVARARDGLRAWEGRGDTSCKLAVLSAVIAGIKTRHEDLAQAIHREMGAPLAVARSAQVDAALAHLEATRAALVAHETTTEVAQGGHFTHFEPLGVAALITPWNWPLNQIALKVGGALAAGCAMVLKPSEQASLSGLIFAQVMAGALAAADAPQGLFSLVLGAGDTGAALVAARGVDVISFTGSTAVGRRIGAAAGGNLIPCALELGGKSANILFDDCDVDLAVTQGVAHCLRNSGQSCNAASRMLVARAIYDRVVAKAAAESAAYDVASAGQGGESPGARNPLGPLVNARQFAAVQDHIAQALDEGARLVAGGLGRPEGVERGYFCKPTVFADVTPEMAIFQREVFGPVLVITPFDSEDEAIALANATDYGLAGYVQTRDPARLARVGAQLRCGMVQANGQSRAAGAPFGGTGASGFGREAGIWGIRAFQRVKSLSGVPDFDRSFAGLHRQPPKNEPT
ncbi:3-succinoylsemialdehyde-pyridine dehydrogenase [Aquimixticola soesokkakensis]|uniref:aldehyde dehydrogenase (NAD(+)) n=1 Tax=Aquimixticola soesokkakensis TaxID=1519096 RepID=A0A1Y5T8J5_9RHOB|nr:aldehyde dehydrogenase family protein [Aquimixticola soesokkakensis]SLN57820.1 3-succinoylsemialdehyde-pyridine dehydrogenase [Aquimixticola soesokkakensis]